MPNLFEHCHGKEKISEANLFNYLIYSGEAFKIARSAKIIREMSDIKSLLSEENLNYQKIHLHKEGLFYVAYERSCLRRLETWARIKPNT